MQGASDCTTGCALSPKWLRSSKDDPGCNEEKEMILQGTSCSTTDSKRAFWFSNLGGSAGPHAYTLKHLYTFMQVPCKAAYK